MARTALVSPCASFGKTADVEKGDMLYEFDSYVSGDDFNDSSEFIVFGDNPEFDEIFHPKSPVLKFWKSHREILGLPKNDTPKVFIVS